MRTQRPSTLRRALCAVTGGHDPELRFSVKTREWTGYCVRCGWSDPSWWHGWTYDGSEW